MFAVLPLAAAATTTESSNFLVSPNVGLMLWTLIAFFVAFFILRKYAWPQISAALDKRQHAIEESIEVAERTKAEAEQLLAEYRERLKEARAQADEIVVRARKAAEVHERETIDEAKAKREELMEQTRRDVEQETRRALDQIRREVADLTVLATEKVARKSLDDDDHRRLIEEALSEFDFEALSPSSSGRPSGDGAAA
jgi:F-type H+-transporting ATPase subunit b